MNVPAGTVGWVTVSIYHKMELLKLPFVNSVACAKAESFCCILSVKFFFPAKVES